MIYVFCHIGAKRPSGGVKILFEMTQALINAGHEAAILIPGAHLYPNDCPKDYKPSWFETSVPVFDDVRIVTSEDIVVMHEEGVWAFDDVMSNKPKYLVINQGAQSSIANNVGKNITYDYVRKIYDGAEAVITVSPYITEFVHSVFGVPHEKIYLIENMIDTYFESTVSKDNTILVLDKAKSLGSELVIKVYNERYPGWLVEVIDNYTHKQLADAMARSKIFVFFASNSGEGSPMPPAEAAIAGCKVIGNTGIGGKFFFHPPIFSEIEGNDILSFITEMDLWTATLNDGTINQFPDAVTQREQLTHIRSKEVYENRVKNVFEKVLTFL